MNEAASARKSPHLKNEESPSAGTPQSVNSTSANAGTPPDGSTSLQDDQATDAIGSPFKRHRASMPGISSAMFTPLDSQVGDALPAPASAAPNVKTEEGQPAASTSDVKLDVKVESDEEL